MTIDEIITAFVSDARQRVAEIGILLDDTDKSPNSPYYRDLENQAEMLSQFLDCVYVNRYSFEDNENRFLDWTDAEIITETEYLRYWCNVKNLPFQEIVSYFPLLATINELPPGSLLPGGLTNQILRKRSNNDYDVEWATLFLSMITDITATAFELNKMHGYAGTTAQLNWLVGVTSSIQDQLNNLHTLILNSSANNVALISQAVAYLTALNSQLSTYLQSLIAQKQDIITGAASTVVTSNLTPNLPLVSDVNGKIATGSAATSLLTRIVDIVDWDMSSAVNKSVAHGIVDISKIRKVSVIIRDDAGSAYYPCAVYTDTLVRITYDATNVGMLNSVTVPIFTGASYNQTGGYVRGWITIEYLP